MKLPELPALPINDPAAAHKVMYDYGKACAKAAQPQWCSIETAPKDEFILMYLPLAYGDYEIHILAITEYGLIDIFDDVTTYGIDDFTHWMPLPEIPTKDTEI